MKTTDYGTKLSQPMPQPSLGGGIITVLRAIESGVSLLAWQPETGATSAKVSSSVLGVGVSGGGTHIILEVPGHRMVCHFAPHAMKQLLSFLAEVNTKQQA